LGLSVCQLFIFLWAKLPTLVDDAVNAHADRVPEILCVLLVFDQERTNELFPRLKFVKQKGRGVNNTFWKC
jgi:hypothetical protein